MDLTRRQIVAGAAAVAAAVALPDAPAEESVFDWLERVELEAMAQFPLPKLSAAEKRATLIKLLEPVDQRANTGSQGGS